MLTRALITSVLSDMVNATCDVSKKAVRIFSVEFVIRFLENLIASHSQIYAIAFGVRLFRISIVQVAALIFSIKTFNP